MATVEDKHAELVIETPDNSTLAIPMGSEVEAQLAAARRYPRSLALFRQRVTELAAGDNETAASCTYRLPGRGDSNKEIVGPSARFAEIVAYCYQNCRVASRIIEETDTALLVQGLFWDLESNVAKCFEIQRSIVDKYGNKYKPSLVATTATAAGSIALRTATLRAIPKVIWQPLYEATVEAALVTPEELERKRATCLAYFAHLGVSEATVFASIGVTSTDQITPSKLHHLRGYATAIQQGEATADDIFAVPERVPFAKAHPSALNERFAPEPTTPDTPPWELIRTESEAQARRLYDKHCGPVSTSDENTRERCSAAWTARRETPKQEADRLFQ